LTINQKDAIAVGAAVVRSGAVSTTIAPIVTRRYRDTCIGAVGRIVGVSDSSAIDAEILTFSGCPRGVGAEVTPDIVVVPGGKAEAVGAALVLDVTILILSNMYKMPPKEGLPAHAVC